MTTKPFTRRPRIAPPALPTGEIALETPPDLPRSAPTSFMSYVMPGAMVLMVVGMVVAGGLNAASLMMGAMMLMMTLGMLGQGQGGDNKVQRDADRHDFLSYLAQKRVEATQVREVQEQAAEFTHPAQDTLWSLAGTRRMWERRRHDPDFTLVRMASGPSELVTPVRSPQTGPLDEVDPICAVALHRYIDAYSFLENQPQSVCLGQVPLLGLHGDVESTRALTRAVVCELAMFHGPDTVAIVAAVGPLIREHWDFLKWLPHNHHPTLRDGLGPLRMVGNSIEEVTEWLDDEIGSRTFHTGESVLDHPDRQIVVIVDGLTGLDASIPMLAGLRGVTVVDIGAAIPAGGGPARLDIVLAGGACGLGATPENAVWLGAQDGIDRDTATSIVRRIAPYRLADGGTVVDESGAAVGSSNIEDMLGIGDVAQLQPAQTWHHLPERDLLRVPIGVGSGGELVELDLKEPGRGGMGPHGLCIGATGSGKSELLRTLVLALSITHSPDQLNLVLVDFKGGATFLGLDDLPHTAAVITNLADDLTLVDRMYAAIEGEMNRRQEVLRDAGNLQNVFDYERARTGRPELGLAPLPWLFVVCDEFSEMLEAKPEFAELFAKIGRIGRSVGIHLMLASQRLEEGRLRGLDANLRYRIGLKTFTAQESRTVLGVPDAYELPPVPGVGFLKADTEMTRFKAAYVSGPYQPPASAPMAIAASGLAMRPVSFVSGRVDIASDVAETVVVERTQDSSEQRASVLDTVVGRLRGHGDPIHQVWLPPLDASPTLDELLPPLVAGPEGLVPEGGADGSLRCVYALVDLPYEQRRDALVADFSGAAGNGVVVGGPQSGKSTAIRSIVSSLALTHTPAQVQLYVIDLGGGSLAATARLPHVGAVVSRARPDHVRRAVAEVGGIVAEREARFRDQGIESMAQYRRLKEGLDARAAGDPFGDVFLVIDGWGAFHEEFEDLEARVTSIAQRGLSFGVHVLLTASRWSEMRPAVKDALLSRVELRLGDPYESEVDRVTASSVPLSRPGRGVTASKKHMLVALPRIDGVSDAATVSEGFADLADRVVEAWNGPVAPRVRTLPEVLPLADLRASVRTSGDKPDPTLIPIGINEEALAPVFFDLDRDQHLLAYGDVEWGKTTLLRVIIDGLVAAYPSSQLRFLVADNRRELLGLVPQAYIAGYATSTKALEAFLGDLVAVLEQRLPGPDVTPEQLRKRSWWSGPKIVVLVDDHDLVATGSNPLSALHDLVPMARDIGMHVVVTRRSAGASRAAYDPLLQALVESGGVGFVGSGSKDEGPLVGAAKPDPELPPGRARMVRREGTQLVQLAWLDPGDPSAAPAPTGADGGVVGGD